VPEPPAFGPAGEGAPGPRPWPRPLLLLAAALAAGIALESQVPEMFPEPWVWAAPALLFLLSLLGFFPACRRLRSPPTAVILFFALGAALSRQADPPLPSPPSLQSFLKQGHTLFLAEIDRPPEFPPNRTRLRLRLHKAIPDGGSVPVEGKVLLTIGQARQTPGRYLLGDILLVRLNLRPLHNFNNPGGFDYVRAMAEQGVFARAYLADDRLVLPVTGEPLSIRRLPALMGRSLDRFRQNALFWLRAHLDRDEADFYAALLLGYRIPDEWGDHLSRTGLTHLLSISGLHLGMVFLASFWLVRRLVRRTLPNVLRKRDDQSIALWFSLGAAAVYALISGMALPTWRSLFMLILFFLAASRYRRADSLTGLALAALLILALSPKALGQISFQLSFAALFGLFCIYPHLDRLRQFLGRRAAFPEMPGRTLIKLICDAFWVSLAANVMVLPIVAYHFHGISPAGFLANALLVPWTGFVVLPLGLLSLAVFALWPPLGLPFLLLGGWCLGITLPAIRWFSSLSWAFFWVGAVPLWGLAGYYAAVAVLLCPWSGKTRVAALAALLLWVVGIQQAFRLSAHPNSSSLLRVTFLDVGQGSSTLLQFPDGRVMIVDGGGFWDNSFDVGRFVVAPALWHLGIRKIDWMVLSHDHPDHRNGLRFLLSHFSVGEFWESGIHDKGAELEPLSTVAFRRAIRVRSFTELAGAHHFGPCRVRLLHPSPHYLREEWDRKDLNNLSAVLRVDFGGTHLVLPGDIDRSIEERILGGEDLPGQVLLAAPHHGSERSGSPLLFDRLRPRAVVFSCGADNWFGFPSSAVLQECTRRNIRIFRTDLQGAVRARSDGVRWTLTPHLEGKQPGGS